MTEGQEIPKVATQKDDKVQEAPDKEIKTQEYILKFQDGGKVSLEIEKGPIKIERQGPWRVEKAETKYFTPRFSEPLSLGSLLKTGGRYFEVVEPLSNKDKKGEGGESVFVNPIGPDEFEKKKKEGAKDYNEDSGNVPYSKSYTAELLSK